MIARSTAGFARSRPVRPLWRIAIMSLVFNIFLAKREADRVSALSALSALAGRAA
jgi:hypothetical protein